MDRQSQILSLALSGAFALVFSAFSSVANADSRVYACYSSSNGNVRIVSSYDDCRKNEQRVSWNMQGDQGPTGPQGDQGPAGPQGEQGPAGPTNFHYIAVELEGNAYDGGGTVSGPGIECTTSGGSESGDCIEVFPVGYGVILHPIVGPATTFRGWDGPCHGTGDCVISMYENIHLIAEFTTNYSDWSIERAETTYPCGISSIYRDEEIQIYGQLLAPGLTDRTVDSPDPDPSLIAQFGIGPANTLPDGNVDWVWFDANASSGTGVTDEYMITFIPREPPFTLRAGGYDYSFRFRHAGAPFLYADCNGTEDGYSDSDAGKLEILD